MKRLVSRDEVLKLINKKYDGMVGVSDVTKLHLNHIYGNVTELPWIEVSDTMPMEGPSQPTWAPLGGVQHEQVAVEPAQVAPAPITLRQHYAAAALTAILINEHGQLGNNICVKQAFVTADQMIAYEQLEYDLNGNPD